MVPFGTYGRPSLGARRPNSGAVRSLLGGKDLTGRFAFT